MNLNIMQTILMKSFIPSKISVRLYGRWMHRNPAKVVLPFEGSSLKEEKVINLDSVALKKSKDAHADNLKKSENLKSLSNKPIQNAIEKATSKLTPEKSEEIKRSREVRILRAKVKLSELKVFDDNDDVIFEKLKEMDGRLSTLFIKLKSKKDRAKAGHVIVEGWRLIKDGIEAKCPLRYLIFTRFDDLNKLKPDLPKHGVKVYKMPYKEVELWSDVETSPGIFGIFDTPKTENIKRLSKPFPIQIICDNVRVPGNLGAILRAAVGVGCENVYLMKGCVDHWDPKVVRSAAGAHFRLPVHSAVGWEQLPRLIGKDTSVFVADNNAQATPDYVEDSNTNNLDHNIELNIPVLPYYSVEFGRLKSVTLVIGGETEGISEDCYRFATSRNGLRLNIPLQRGVDSLNSGMALAVIAFEIKKQILQMKIQSAYKETSQAF